MTANGRKKEALTAETFMDHVEIQVGCWLWTGNLSNAGYGRWGSKFAHRLSYELYKGSIPVGMEVDHLCFNPACVRPGRTCENDGQRRRYWQRQAAKEADR